MVLGWLSGQESKQRPNFYEYFYEYVSTSFWLFGIHFFSLRYHSTPHNPPFLSWFHHNSWLYLCFKVTSLFDWLVLISISISSIQRNTWDWLSGKWSELHIWPKAHTWRWCSFRSRNMLDWLLTWEEESIQLLRDITSALWNLHQCMAFCIRQKLSASL